MSQEIKFPGINQGVKNPFRWYLSIKKKNKYRKLCQNECVYKLLTPSTALLPFQLYTTLTGTLTLSWNVYDADGTLVESPSASFLQTAQVNNLQYIYYTGGDLGFLMPPGYYYSEIIISDGSGSVTWYSEDFYSTGSCDGAHLIDLCSVLLQSGIGSGPYHMHQTVVDPCGFCITPDSDTPVSIDIVTVFPTTLSLYKLKVQLSSLSCIQNVKFTFGNGDEFTVTDELEHIFYGYNEFGQDLNILITPEDSGSTGCDQRSVCFDVLDLRPQIIIELSACRPVLQWWDYCGLIGEIYYGSSGFKNMLFLEDDVELSDPQNKIVQEGILNGEKDFIPQFIRRTSSWTLELGLQPPYIVQALYEMITHANKTISLPSELGGGVSQIINPVINAPYDNEGGGCFATVSLTFETEDTTIVDGCCDGDIPVCEGQPLAGTIEQDSVLCATGGTTSLAATGTSVAPGITYQWEWSLNGGTWNEATTGIGGTTVNYTTFPLPDADSGDEYCFRMRTDCFASEMSNYSNEVCVVYDDDGGFTIGANSSSPACAGGAIGLFGTWSGNSPLTNWQWSGPGGYSANTQNATRSNVNPSHSGTYIVTAQCEHGCLLTATVEVVVNEKPELTVGSIVHTTGGLNNGEVHLTVLGGTPLYIYYLGGVAQLNGDYTGLAAGSYDATVIDDNGCEDEISGIIVN